MAEFPTTLGTFSPSFSSETLQAVGDDLPVVCWSVQWHMRFGWLSRAASFVVWREIQKLGQAVCNNPAELSI